jgi:hypothetical protein
MRVISYRNIFIRESLQKVELSLTETAEKTIWDLANIWFGK